MIETWANNIDENKQNLAMFLDVSAAFNCVNHDILDKN